MATDDAQESSKQEFLYPRARYYGEFTPEKLAFNANLQEFGQRVSYLCSLETSGKITTLEAYKSVKQAWKELKDSKQGLGIGEEPPSPEDS